MEGDGGHLEAKAKHNSYGCQQEDTTYFWWQYPGRAHIHGNDVDIRVAGDTIDKAHTIEHDSRGERAVDEVLHARFSGACAAFREAGQNI